MANGCRRWADRRLSLGRRLGASPMPRAESIRRDRIRVHHRRGRRAVARHIRMQRTLRRRIGMRRMGMGHFGVPRCRSARRRAAGQRQRGLPGSEQSDTSQSTREPQLDSQPGLVWGHGTLRGRSGRAWSLVRSLVPQQAQHRTRCGRQASQGAGALRAYRGQCRGRDRLSCQPRPAKGRRRADFSGWRRR